MYAKEKMDEGTEEQCIRVKVCQCNQYISSSKRNSDTKQKINIYEELDKIEGIGKVVETIIYFILARLGTFTPKMIFHLLLRK